MTGRSGCVASALTSLMLLGTPVSSDAQYSTGATAQPVTRIAAFAPGSIHGVVRDEAGVPVAGAVVSVIGATTSVVVTDREGRFDLQTLPPGPYMVRAHLAGFVAPRAQLVDVRPSGRSSSSIALRRPGVPTLLSAGIGAAPDTPAAAAAPEPAAAPVPDSTSETEAAWRLRHVRRGILKESTLPDVLVLEDDAPDGFDLAESALSPVRFATSFFADTPFSGQVNLLTTGSFDAPQDLFSSGSLSKGIAYLRLGAPVGDAADWTVRGALSQTDITSWILAGSYTTRVPARHKYDIGMSYATQRYVGGNPLALRDVTDGSRNAGAVYGFDTFTLTPAVALTFGGRYARYDYLDHRGLLSPRLEVTLTPSDRFRISGQLSRRALAPGAEEFLPPAENGIWLPPQRTFSAIEPGRPFEAEHTTHVAVAVERDIAGSTISVGAFRQHVNDQLVTLFGAEMPDQPSANVGHYFVGNAGAIDALGCSAAFRTTFINRVSGSVAYSMTNAQQTPAEDVRYMIVMAPSAIRPGSDRVHDVSGSIETSVPETSTRVLILYRVSNGFARPASGPDASDSAGLDSRFDVQVRQSLPFMNFTSAKWEMLVAVRNFFRETVGHESVYDELLVVRPPKRIVGGVTMRF